MVLARMERPRRYKKAPCSRWMGIILSFRKFGPHCVFFRLRGRAASSNSSSCASAAACRRSKTTSIFESRIGVPKPFVGIILRTLTVIRRFLVYRGEAKSCQRIPEKRGIAERLLLRYSRLNVRPAFMRFLGGPKFWGGGGAMRAFDNFLRIQWSAILPLRRPSAGPGLRSPRILFALLLAAIVVTTYGGGSEGVAQDRNQG